MHKNSELYPENDIKKFQKEIFDVFQFMKKYNILSSYAGPFDNMVLINLAKNLQKNISVNYTFRKRLFKIFIELTSNIAFYSYEKTHGQGNGIIMIREYKDHFKIEAGNIIEKKVKDHLKNKCDLINKLNHQELRKLKRKLLRMPAKNTNSGNIGLVHVALVAKNKLNYLFLPLDKENNLYFYIISIRLNK